MASNQKFNKDFSKSKRTNYGYNINEDIRAFEVRMVGENVEPKICKTSEALNIAKNLGLDLVEISSESNPPVCKVVDFQKFLYEKKKKEKENKSSNKSTTKEIKLGPNIGDHDFEFKLKHAIEFLSKGHKVKAYMQFRGREISHKKQGEIVMLKFMQALENYGKPEFLPKLEGKNLYVIINPKKS